MTTATGGVGGVREAVRALRERDPEITAASLARIVGVSRARIRQILVEEGLRTSTTRSPGAKPRPNLEVVRHMQEVLQQMDAQIRSESYCATCSKPMQGIQWLIHHGGGSTQQNRAEAGLCVCP